ncbi:DUF4376 domain-containing protein [Salmonella enterica]|nr:DUF4376 domain-containing protein [Salmonella enterica]
MGYTDVVKDARNGRYDENGNIIAEVQFADRDDWLECLVTRNDPQETVRQLFDALESGQYGAVTPWVETAEMLAEEKRAKHEEINVWRNTQENANYVFQFDNHKWDYGKATQERLSLSVQMAKTNKLPEGFAWTDADNNDVPMTAGELLNLSDAIDQAMFKKGLEIHMRQRQMKQEIDEMSDRMAVKYYRPGWPPASATDSNEAGN